MKAWQKATNKFLKKYKKEDYVIASIACGSYITGNPTKHSDIDLRIITDNKTNWRERGNKIVDNFLIESFDKPLYFKRIYKFFINKRRFCGVLQSPL
jgi:predicted nucleotidyltransferase